MALILADTSVWIDYFCAGTSAESGKLGKYLEEDRICITSIIRAEILSGARNEDEFGELDENLSALPLLEDPHDLWDQVARSRFLLARKGIQSSMTDLAIAVLACHHQCMLFTRDKEFKQIATVLSLKFV
jgi:predicted nucleic acid-binding protein